MKIILSPMGTDGDIRPFIALGTALIKAGSDIRMVVPKNAVGLCDRYRIPYVTIDFDYRNFVEMVSKKAAQKDIINILDTAISGQFSVLAEAAKGADLIIGSAANYAVGSIAELYGVPYYQVWHLIQVLKSSQHPPWRVKGQTYPRWFNRVLWKLSDLKDDGIGKMFINKHRIRLGLKPIDGFGEYFRKNIVLAADRSLVSVPSDVTGEYVHTDYWHLFENDALDSSLIEFITTGKAPVYFGFGSMADQTMEETVQMLEDIAESLDIRFVVQKGWAGYMEIVSNRIKFIDAVPHHKLFGRMAAVIHHGGAGTTHNAALAGVPQVVVPQIGDQFYWGGQVYRLKLGPKPVHKTGMTADQLKKAISLAISNDEIRENSLKMGNTLKERDSVDQIIKQLKLV